MGNRLDRAYARALIDFEVRASLSQLWEPTPEELPIQQYAMSTENRRLFCMLMVRAALDNVLVTPTNIALEVGISRNTVDTMIKEGEVGNWLIVERDQNKRRSIKAAENMVNVYVRYANAVADYTQDADLAGLSTAKRYAKRLCIPGTS
jgi:hypothetical protein